MVQAAPLALAALSLGSGALLALLLLRLHRALRRLDDGRAGRAVFVALGLVGFFLAVRVAQALAPTLDVQAAYLLRNTAWAVAWALVLRAALRLPDLRPGARSGAFVLAATGAVPGIASLAFGFTGILPFAIGAGLLAGTVAVVAWRLRDEPAGSLRQQRHGEDVAEGNVAAAPGVPTLALAGAMLLAVLPWVDGLVLSAALGGEPRLFFVSRLWTDSALGLGALFALPAARDLALRLEAAAAPADAAHADVPAAP